MTRVAVTGSDGFIGRNVMEALDQEEGFLGEGITRETTPEQLREILARADTVLHLAGSNRPEDPAEFERVNAAFTAEVVDVLLAGASRPPLVYASSTRVEEATPYGRSKLAGEHEVERYGAQGGIGRIARLPNVFGKWCRPDYNSAVATFCHRVARGQEIDVHDAEAPLTLVHVADVVTALLDLASAAGPAPGEPGVRHVEVDPVFETTVGWVADTIRSFASPGNARDLPDLSDPLTRRLHSTYLSHVPTDALQHLLEERADDRGRLAELVRSAGFGQVFVSTTRPGVVRGEHSHRVKTEKFFVLAGTGVIRIRRRDSDEILEFTASGERWSVVDIPPGTVHDIENVGEDDMIVLFWASEVFDPEAPDTYQGRV